MACPVPGYAMQTDHLKSRTLKLADEQQTAHAAALLVRQLGIAAQAGTGGQLTLHYALDACTLAQVLAALDQAGIPLAAHALQRWQYHLACYGEQVQLDNLHCPRHDTKGREAFCRVYQQHLHGDRDDTPEELRLEK